MTLGELLKVCEHVPIQLHSAYNGKLVAKKRKSLERYSNVEVCSIYPRFELSRYGDFAQPYLYVFGHTYQIDEIKKTVNTENG